MDIQRNFEEEHNLAKLEAERITTCLQAHGYEVDNIDYERAGRLAYVSINGTEVDDVLTLSRASECGQLLKDVRYKLLEAAAQQHLHSSESAVSWVPLDLPEGTSPEIQSLWRIHLSDDGTHPGVNIAEVLRGGCRTYEYYPGGPTPGVHTFYIDKVTPRALRLLREAGGTVSYHPDAQRADGERGRRRVNLPEGTIQESESEELMAPQRFTLPNGAALRLEPQWYVVELYAADERLAKGEEAS